MTGPETGKQVRVGQSDVLTHGPFGKITVALP